MPGCVFFLTVECSDHPVFLTVLFHMPLPRLKIHVNACTSICCKAGVAQTVTPFWLAQHGEKLGPSAGFGCQHLSLSHLPHSAIFLISSLDSWGCIRISYSSLVMAFHFFLSTEFSFPEFTFLTHVLSPPSFPLPRCYPCSSSLSPCRASLLMDQRACPFPGALGAWF